MEPDRAVARAASGSAAVPAASRALPPPDLAGPAMKPAPQSRVYGRPTAPDEADHQPGPAEPGGWDADRPGLSVYGAPPAQSGPEGDRFPDDPPATRVAVPGARAPQAGDLPKRSSAVGGAPFGDLLGPGAAPGQMPGQIPGGMPGQRPAGRGPDGPGQPDAHRFGGPGQADRFGGPAPFEADRFGGPGQPDPGRFSGPGQAEPDRFGGPGPSDHDRFSGPGQADAGRFGGPPPGQPDFGASVPAAGGPPGYGMSGPPGAPPAAYGAPGGTPMYGSPPPPGPGWGGADNEQGRFDSFKPEPEPQAPPEPPTPQVRNGKVLFLVLVAAVLLLAIPLGTLWLLGKIGGENTPAPFNPAVGACVKDSGGTPVIADCAEQGVFKVASKVADKAECPPNTPQTIVIPGRDELLCLQPAAAAGGPTPSPNG